MALLGKGGSRIGWVWEGGSRLSKKKDLGRGEVGLAGIGMGGVDCLKKVMGLGMVEIGLAGFGKGGVDCSNKSWGWEGGK